MFNFVKSLVLVSALLISIQSTASNVQRSSAQNTDSTMSTEPKISESNVSIEWIDPQKFRDVEHPTTSRKRYRESVFLELETFFATLGEKLPLGYTLHLKVTDLDMAGTVQTPGMAGLNDFSNQGRFGMQDYRIMRDIDIPRITFSYEYLDDKGQIVKQEEVTLKDMSYLSRGRSINNSAALHYEKVMISRWFEETFQAEG
jgi:Asp-tRNA(Asn)/Glu-tRNA(Gln) amidotransferase B subunit